ncbi:MAG: family 14 glycosylhydrolase, partial [Myxococcota bacterium]
MAPLLVGDPNAPQSDASKAAFVEFKQMLAEMKAAGVHSVSTDVWWGLVEPKNGVFDFSHYDRVADAIIGSGLKWTPILSFHQCGGNVGDSVDIPIPSYLRDRYAHLSDEGAASAFCRSEQNNVSYEAISPFASQHALGDYIAVMRAFATHFQHRAADIAEVNVSLGPAGELRYPSYNSHDRDTDYPTRGALQAYSTLARQSFRSFVLDKYGSVPAAAAAWNTTLNSVESIGPPSDAAGFFGRGDDKNTEYGRDFFDWYHGTLLDHGSRILKAAQDVFGAAGSAFAEIPLGAKSAGVHWRIGSDRAAELAAGL